MPDLDHKELEALDSGREGFSTWVKAGGHRALNLRDTPETAVLLFSSLRTELGAWCVLSMCSTRELPLTSCSFFLKPSLSYLTPQPHCKISCFCDLTGNILGLKPKDSSQLAPGHDPSIGSVKMRCYMEKQKHLRGLGKATSQAQGA